MKIKNTTNSQIIIQDLPGAQGGEGLILSPQQEVCVYDEDAEKSKQLSSLMTSGLIIKTGNDEPSEGEPSGDASNGDIADWITSGDVMLQFLSDAGTIAGVNPAIFTGTAGTAKSVRLVVTDGHGTRDILNSVSTVLVTATGGTVNGGSTATVTLNHGMVTLSIASATPGNVDLALSAFTHPQSAAIPPTEVNVTNTAQVQFA